MTTRFIKLWGITSDYALVPGDVVDVTKTDGSVTQVVAGLEVPGQPGVYLTAGRPPKGATPVTPPARPATNGRARRPAAS